MSDFMKVSTVQGLELSLPKSQNAKQTRGSAPLKIAASRALYMAQEDAGDPGRGNMSAMGTPSFGEAGHGSENGGWTHGPRAINRQASNEQCSAQPKIP